MATRIYIDATDFDALKGHFTIEGVDNQYYLRIGALNSEDQRLIASLIDDGFVGFFQDEVRIAIAGIVSTYDATNDRIEIDRELPELQIEDAYVIRFTQARPGEDGDGGIGTPGEDGEHAEIEIEDTNTGIRVRGKSGGEPDFGPWQDVRDGIDGQDGIDGEPGQDGDDGEHAEIEVEDTPPDNENAPGIRVRGKSGGETDFGAWHYVQDGKDGEDGVGSEGNPLVTRGELIATSSFLNRNTLGSLNNPQRAAITWTINTTNYGDPDGTEWGDTGDEAYFEAHPTEGRLAVPYARPEKNILGFWAVAEDLSEPEGSREIYEVFIPWGLGAVESGSTYFGSRHIIHFGRASGEGSIGGDDVVVYFRKRRDYDYKGEITISTYGGILPSTQCRVRIYLAGAFGSVYEKAGDDGWSPKFATVPHDERRVLQVADWFGGGGTKPDVGQYIGETGFVAAIAEAVDIRGPAGEDGEDGTGICTALTVLNDSNGTQNLRSVELPTNYTDYDNIYFNIFGNNEFRQNSLKISTLVNGRLYRIGGISDIVWNETSRTFTLNDGRAAGNFRHVILTGCEDDGGDSNDGEDGWSPKFAIKSHGERRVLQVADWFGGGGIKPVTGKYIGLNSFVDAIADGVDVRGPKGQDGGDGGPGPQGPPGQDGIGNVQMTAGLFTPEALTIHYHNLNGQWGARNPSNSWINISGETGAYYRWGNYVLFYACFSVDIGSSLNGKARYARIFIAPPHGRNSKERLADAHGMGTPIKEEAGWFPVNVTRGDSDSDVDSNGNPTGDPVYNSIMVDCIAVNQTAGSGFAAISISGMYKIITS